MTLNNFFKLNQGGGGVVSIHQLPYDYGSNRYSKTYFEENYKEDILQSNEYSKIKSAQVDHFSIIGGGCYPVELCIFLRQKE